MPRPAMYLEIAGSASSSGPAAPPPSLRAAARVAAPLGLVAAAVAAVVLVARPHGPPAVDGHSRLDVVRLDAEPASQENLKPIELLHDGNVCDINEELFEGLCYKKCSLLTMGEASIRTSAWTCCASHPCTPFNEKAKLGMKVVCTGYDVGADGGCPHKPGACLVDEELYGGMCFEKCATLTGGAFPNRVGPATCCSSHGLGCLNPKHVRTSSSLAVGGGAGDHDPLTLATAHLPQVSLTEDESAKTKQERREPVGVVKAGAVVDSRDLKPAEVLDDGNVCEDNEELYGGLCYKRCSFLTDGRASIRTSSWTCCASHPCLPWNQLGSVGSSLLCNGYDVSGDGSCPHEPGACLVDEELFLGVCYKRCSLLTEGAFPHRFAPATCCKTKGLGCLDIFNDRTRKNFDVGGGAGDHDASTPAQAHAPLEELTEEGPETARGGEAPAAPPKRLRTSVAA